MGIEVAFGGFPLGFRYGAERAICWLSSEKVAVAHGDCVSYFDAATLQERRRAHVGHHVTGISVGASLLLVSTEIGALIALDRETLEERSRVVINGARWALLSADETMAGVVREGKIANDVSVNLLERVRVADGSLVDDLRDPARPYVGGQVEFAPSLATASTSDWSGVAVYRVPSAPSTRVSAGDVSQHALLSDDALLVGSVKGSVRRVALKPDGTCEIVWEISLGTSPVRRLRCASGLIGVATEEGVCVILEEDGKERARWKMGKGVRAVIPAPDGERALLVTQAGGDVLAPPKLSMMSAAKPKAVAATAPMIAECTALSIDHNALIVGTEDGDVLRLSARGLAHAALKNGPVRGLRATPDGESIAVVGKQLAFIDPESLVTQRQLKVAGLGAIPQYEAARIGFDESGTRVTFISQRRATAVDATSAKLCGALESEEDTELTAAAWSVGALVAVDDRGRLLRRDAKPGALLKDRAKPTAAAFTEDGARLAIAWGNGDASRVAVVDVARGAIESEAAVGGRIVALAWNRDNSALAVASDRAFEVRAATLSGDVVRVERPAGYPFDLALSRDGATLWTVIHLALDALVGDLVPGELRAYDAASGALRGTIVVGDDAKCAAVIVDGRVELLGDTKRAKRLVVAVEETNVTPVTNAALREGLLRSLLSR